MALFVGCGDGCSKKEKTTPAPAAQGGGGTTAVAETPADEKGGASAAAAKDAGSSENLEDTAAYVKTQYEGKQDATSTRQDPGIALDTSFDIEPDDWTKGKTYDTTKPGGAGGAGADTWSAGSKDGHTPDRDRLKGCAHKNTSLNAKDLCAKINKCGERETCEARLSLDGALINTATADAFKACIKSTECSAVGEQNDGLYGLCFGKAIGAQPAQGADICTKITEKLEGCSLSGTATAFKGRCAEVLKPLRSSVLDAYALCSNAACGDVVKCVSNAGCGTFALE
jgi:hypothetical protein